MKFPGFKKEHIATYIFIVLFIFSIAPVWIFPHFLTADGPCHVYNSTVLDKWLHGEGEYYRKFYRLNTVLFPNWFSHAFLVLLLQVFPAEIAGKLIITVCLFCFAFGFKYYIESFSAKQSYYALWVFPFLWQMAMLMGFYNYMFSIGTYFWITGFWMRNRNSMSWGKVLLIMLACVLVYFMHVFGVLLTVITIMLITFWDIVITKKALIFKILLAVLPALALTIHYVKPGGEYSRVPLKHLWDMLACIFTIQNLTELEGRYAHLVAIILGVFTLIALLFAIIKYRKVAEWQVPFILLLFILGFYFRGNGQALGGSYILERLESLSYLFALVFIAAVPLPRFLSYISALGAVILTVLFVGNRFPVFKETNNVINEMQTLAPMIKDKSVVLPLKYTNFPSGTNGQQIAPKIYYFAHVMETIDVKKDIIYFDNYEGFTYYFPLIWNEDISPFIHLAKGDGIEAAPPGADLVHYNKNFAPVNYIVIFGGEKVAADTSSPAGLLSKQIDENYNLVHTTPVYRIKLYELK